MSKHKKFAAAIAAVLCLTMCGLSAFAEEISDAQPVDPPPVVSEDPVSVDPADPVDPPSEDPGEISNGGDTDPDNNGGEYSEPDNNYNNGGEYNDPDNNNNNNGGGQNYYYDSDGNSYTDQNDVYVGGGQVYEPPKATAPSAALYKTDGRVEDGTMKQSDWSDIAERLKNADSNGGDDGGDFAAIQNNSSAADNGHWILIAGLACMLLSLAGIVYFIVSLAHSRRKYVSAPAPQKSAPQTNRYRSDDYNDGFKSEPKRKSGGKRYK